MATNIVQYKIFFSSTLDLIEEFEAINRVVEELNRTWASHNNCTIKIINCRTDVAPGISNGNVQNLINATIGNDYDLYIGVLWKRFGTATDNAESGTEEEFKKAYNRFKDDPNTSQVLFYFSSKPISPDEIDIDQFSKIQRFQKELETLGVLYSKYSDIIEFEKNLRQHIQIRLTNLRSEHVLSLKEKAPDDAMPSDGIEEMGILEAQELFLKQSNSISECMQRITKLSVKAAKLLAKKNSDINRLHKNTSFSVKIKHMSEIASALTSYAQNLERETNSYSSFFEKMINAALVFFPYLTTKDKIVLTPTIRTTEESYIEFRDVVFNNIGVFDNFPPMTSDIIKAKRLVSEATKKLYNELNKSIYLLSELQ